jgi:hypothetical protein
VDDEVLGRLEDAYPRIAFIVHTEDDVTLAPLPPRLRVVAPPLTPQQERDLENDYEDAIDGLRQQAVP